MSDDPKVSEPATTAQPDADAAKPTSAGAEASGATGADAGDEDELTRLRRENLEAKIRAEERNRELRELKEALNGRQAPSLPPAGVDPRMAQMQQALLNLQLRAQAGDDDAILQLGMIENQQMQAKMTNDELMLARIPEKDQAVVRKFYSENRQRFGDPDAAYAYVERERLRKQVSEVEQERERQRTTEAQKRNGVVSVTTRPVPSAEAERIRMSPDEFETRYSELVAQGKTQEAWALSRKAATGELFRS